MLKKLFLSLYMSLAALPLFSEINVGPAINNLNGRVFTLENTRVDAEEVLSWGFLTNEIDAKAILMIGNLFSLNTQNTNNLVLSINEVNDKASYPVKLYGGSKNQVGTNNWIEFTGTEILLFTNGILSSKIATTNDINNAIQNFYNINFSRVGPRSVTPTTSFLSALSNSVYTADTGGGGIVFMLPETNVNKESKITIHLYKNTGNVTWFSNINWVYGEPPQFEVPNTNYVFQFETLNGINWRGWIEYIY